MTWPVTWQGMAVALVVVLVGWYLWQSYLERQVEAQALAHAKAVRERWKVPKQSLARKQLREFGGNRDRTILVSVNGRIYNVWRTRHLYEDGGSYELFAGRECGRALSKMSFEATELEGRTDNLCPGEAALLNDWLESYEIKHDFVGLLEGWDGGGDQYGRTLVHAAEQCGTDSLVRHSSEPWKAQTT